MQDERTLNDDEDEEEEEPNLFFSLTQT